jgi:hypothetical protein
MTFYSELAEVAVELLTEFGQAITLTRTTGKSIDPVTGAITPGTSDNQPTIGVIKPYAKNLIDGTLIQVGDKEVILSPAIAPLTSDTINGMQVVNITEINPAGTVLVYKVQVRG